MALVHSLYPPIMPDTIPAFVRTQTCRIYFALSSYNRFKDIKNVQISLINQKTNLSALKTDLYPSGIKLANINQDTSITTNYRYYIQIIPTDLVNQEFALNQFYKLQLRFTSIEAETPPAEGGLNTWLSNNLQYFSQWSTVCLIKGIEQPHISIEDFNTDGTQTILNTPLSAVVGRMYYENNIKEQEYLKSYNIKIYKDSVSDSNLLFNTGEIYTNKYGFNEINCEINYNLLNDMNYILVLSYTTNNLYTNTEIFNFKIVLQQEFILSIITSFEEDPENGRIKIIVDFDDNYHPTEDLMIRRASSKTNFTRWETLKTLPSDSGFIWYDTSIESGVWYKYRIQQAGGNHKLIDSENPIMCVFEDVFLTNGTKQLKIQFNPLISSFKYNVSESQQITLGSQYPYVKRNGNTFYRTFSIGGLISSLIDMADWYNPNYYDYNFHSANHTEPFNSKVKAYGDAANLYSNYNKDNNINDYQDYIYEREFRESVEDFLYKYDVKLFRSLTEGNILIKLMDITLQPVNELGRLLYSFTATAIEIGDASVSNYRKYNIINNYYHQYSHGELEATFNPFESVFDKVYNAIAPSVSKNLISLLKMSIETTTDNAVFYLIKSNTKEPTRMIFPANTELWLQDINHRYIQDCYFYGQNFVIEDITYDDKFYEDFPSEPIENTVYNILINNNENKQADYESYDNTSGILTVTDQGVLHEPRHYSLLLGRDYNTYIYKDGNWYLIDLKNSDIGFPVQATIAYDYEILKEG